MILPESVMSFIKQIPEIFWLEDGPFDAKWAIVPIDAVEDLPKVQGIYIVITDNDELLYIGKAKNLHERWRTGHHKAVKFFGYSCPNILYIELPDLSRGDLSKLEAFYIRKHSPVCQG